MKGAGFEAQACAFLCVRYCISYYSIYSEQLLRADPHGNPIWNWDIAGLPRGMGAFCGSAQMEGLGLNLYVVPADSLGPSIS